MARGIKKVVKKVSKKTKSNNRAASKRKLSPSEEKQLCRMHKNRKKLGLMIKDICKKFKIAQPSLYVILRRYK